MTNRYWVGGAGTWNLTNTTNWAATSGGPGGESVPTSADDVYFDAASNATSYTITTPGNTTDMVCRNLNVAGPATGTLTFSNTISQVNIFGNLVHAASGIAWGGNVVLLFASTSIGNTITTNGFSFVQNLIFNGVGGEWTLQDSLTTSSVRFFTLTNGSVKLNNNTLTCGLFSTNTVTARNIDFGTGKIVVSGNNAALANLGFSGMTVSGSRRVEFSYAGGTGTRTIALIASAAESNALDFYILGGTDTVVCSGASRFVRVLDFTGFAGTLNVTATGAQTIFGNLLLTAGMTVGANNFGFSFAATSGTQQITTNGKTLDMPLTFNGVGGTFAFQDALTQGATRAFTITNGTVQLKNGVTSTVGAFATSGTNQKFLQSTLAGSQATLSQASGIVNVSYLTIKDIIATGGATWNAFVSQGNADAGNNTGWDFLVQLGRYMYTRRKNKRILQ